jgi:hypothetical protein
VARENSSWDSISEKKNKTHQEKAGGAAQGVGPEFKPQYHQKKKEFKGNSTQGHQEDPSSPSETMTILKVIRLK